MAKGHSKEQARQMHTSDTGAAEDGSQPKLTRKEYERELRVLDAELVAMQEWVKRTGAKVCIVFEGRDTAGKGGTIQRITERVSPRVFRVVALPAPNEREKSQMYIQRYVSQLPAGGEVVIFDRSWYNRAGVERVMGFCTPEESDKFLEQVPDLEKTMVESGIILLKYWLEVSEKEQTRRLESRINDPRKIWKLSEMDLKGYSRWYDYSRARDAMFADDRHRVGAVVGRQHRRQTTGPAQHHQPPARAASPTSRSRSTRSSCPNGNIRAATPHPTCRSAASRPRSESKGHRPTRPALVPARLTEWPRVLPGSSDRSRRRSGGRRPLRRP